MYEDQIGHTKRKSCTDKQRAPSLIKDNILLAELAQSNRIGQQVMDTNDISIGTPSPISFLPQLPTL